jgi:glutamate 5-kinase
MKKMIVKVGTSTLTQGTHVLSRRSILGLVQQIAELSHQGILVVIVSSGAVATGKALLNSSQISASKQTCASIGQVKLMQVWAELFSLFELQVAQVLLTKEDFYHSKRETTKETILDLLQHGIIPIINENDAVSTKDARIGNNDVLAALVVELIQADRLILLTDQEGLYTADPRVNTQAQLISTIEQIDQTIFRFAGGSSTSLGTGGMTTKIEAAQIAAKSGIRTIIASSSRPHVLTDLAKGEKIGTEFLEETLR